VVGSRVAAVVFAAALTFAAGAEAQLVGSPRPCVTERLTGSVSTGQEFQADLGAALRFRLDPGSGGANPPGWTIRVTPPDAPQSDHAMVATPPYRFANPRYVDTAYGVTAEEALAMSPRSFAFVASAEDYGAARDALDVLLWPAEHTEAEVEAARSTMADLPVYPATFTILEGSTLAGDSAHPNGVIERMSFEVELCLPR